MPNGGTVTLGVERKRVHRPSWTLDGNTIVKPAPQAAWTAFGRKRDVGAINRSATSSPASRWSHRRRP